MESYADLNPPFDVEADILGDGTKTKLFIMPQYGSYWVVLDGVDLAKIKHSAGPPERWETIEGNLDQQAVNIIGAAIESHYM